MTSTNIPTPALHDLWRAGPRELATSLRIRLREQRRLDAEIGQIIAEVESRGVKDIFGYGSTTAWLQDLGHLGTADTKKIVQRALAVNPSHGLDGTPLPATAPLTGAVAQEGLIGAGQIDQIIATMKALPATVSGEDREVAEKILVDLAREAGPLEIKRAGQRLLDTLAPDGPEPKDPNPHESYISKNTATAPQPSPPNSIPSATPTSGPSSTHYRRHIPRPTKAATRHRCRNRSPVPGTASP